MAGNDIRKPRNPFETHDDPYRLHGFLVTDSLDDFIRDLTACAVPERVQ
jgi:hypothetical protein